MEGHLVYHDGKVIACEITAEDDDERRFILALDQQGAIITGAEVTGMHISLILPTYASDVT